MFEVRAVCIFTFGICWWTSEKGMGQSSLIILEFLIFHGFVIFRPKFRLTNQELDARNLDLIFFYI